MAIVAARNTCHMGQVWFGSPFLKASTSKRRWRAETKMVVYSSVGLVLTNMPRISSDSCSVTPSSSSFCLNECCRFTIHWKRESGSGRTVTSSGNVALDSLTAIQCMRMTVSSLL